MEFQSGKATRKSLGLTVYNNGFASVRELRSLGMGKEKDRLAIRDLPTQIEADSLYVTGISVRELSFESGRFNKGQLLNQHIGRLITIKNMESGEEMKIRLLAAFPDLIGEKEDSGEIVINPTGYLVLPPSKDGLKTSPALLCQIEPSEETTEFELFYLTAGIMWEAHFTAELRNGKISLDGWMIIENQTGMDFENCNLKAVAGIVKRAGHHMAAIGNDMFKMEAMEMPSEEYEFAEAHVYKSGKPFSISDGQTKRIQFMHESDIPFTRIYRVEERKSNAAVYLQFGNADVGAPSIPLPAGIMKFYERDQEGDLEFIGENRIANTPANEKLMVKIGEAFDLTTKARERSRKKIEGHEYVTFEYQIINSKKENVGVLVEHTVNDPIWEMETSTHDYEVINSHELEFHVRIGAGKTVEVEFTYKVENTLQPLAQ